VSQPLSRSAWPELSLVHLTRPPRAAGAGTPPLLIQLHGVGSNERDLFHIGDLLDPRFLVLSVRAPLVRGPDSFAWFDVRPLPDGSFVINAEQLRASCDRLVRFVEEAAAAYRTDPRRVYLLGFSQGAIVSLATALSHPHIVAGLVALSGRFPPEARPWLAPMPELAGLPLFLAHGTLDRVIRIEHAYAARDLLQSLPVALNYREYVMGHIIGPDTLHDLQAWLTARLDEPRRREPGADAESGAG
jgi:phospholipase/carboxylesterase